LIKRKLSIVEIKHSVGIIYLHWSSPENVDTQLRVDGPLSPYISCILMSF